MEVSGIEWGHALFEWAIQAVSSQRTCEGVSGPLHPMLNVRVSSNSISNSMMFVLNQTQLVLMFLTWEEPLILSKHCAHKFRFRWGSPVASNLRTVFSSYSASSKKLQKQVEFYRQMQICDDSFLLLNTSLCAGEAGIWIWGKQRLVSKGTGKSTAVSAPVS